MKGISATLESRKKTTAFLAKNKKSPGHIPPILYAKLLRGGFAAKEGFRQIETFQRSWDWVFRCTSNS